MEIKIHSIHFDADKKLLDFIETKVAKIDKLSNNIIAGDVTLRLNKSKSPANKISEIKLNAPGKDFFVRKQSRSFEEAIDASVDALKKQVERHKRRN